LAKRPLPEDESPEPTSDDAPGATAFVRIEDVKPAPSKLPPLRQAPVQGAPKKGLQVTLPDDDPPPPPKPKPAPVTEARPEPTRPATTTTPAATTMASQPAVSAPSPLRPWAFASLGVGVVGLGFGIGFGAAALSDKSRLDGLCDASKACTPSAADPLAALRRDAMVSTVGWVVGGVGLAGSLVLFLVAAASPAGRTAWLVPTAGGVEVRW